MERFGYDLSELKTSTWILIKDPQNTSMVRNLKEILDEGESAAITLALEVKASNLIIDEKKGRRVASEMGLEVIGLIGVLIEAKQLKVIMKVKPILDELISKANFRIAPQFYHRIITILGEND